ncbi:MAG: aminoglycoside N(3)-acetyltransferase [Halodesulfurarchaeum sp.]
MDEADVVARTDEPVTRSALETDLRDLGVETGGTLLVHASMSAVGWVSGGAQTVVDALLAAVGEAGTLVMPTHTGQFSDPADWQNPPIPEEWVRTVRETRPGFDPERSPSRGVGRVAEAFRCYPGVRRSDHPLYSFAARGPGAEAVVGDHPLDYGLGPDSPLGAIYERDGQVLLLGTDHESNTSLHLAEYLAGIEAAERRRRAPVRQDDGRATVQYRDIDLDVSDFDALGEAFEADGGSETGAVGNATALLMDQRAVVDYAVDFFEATR